MSKKYLLHGITHNSSTFEAFTACGKKISGSGDLIQRQNKEHDAHIDEKYDGHIDGHLRDGIPEHCDAEILIDYNVTDNTGRCIIK